MQHELTAFGVKGIPHTLDTEVYGDHNTRITYRFATSDNIVEATVCECNADTFLLDLLIEVMYARSKAALMKEGADNPHTQALDNTTTLLQDMDAGDVSKQYVKAKIEEKRDVPETETR